MAAAVAAAPPAVQIHFHALQGSRVPAPHAASAPAALMFTGPLKDTCSKLPAASVPQLQDPAATRPLTVTPLQRAATSPSSAAPAGAVVAVHTGSGDGLAGKGPQKNAGLQQHMHRGNTHISTSFPGHNTWPLVHSYGNLVSNSQQRWGPQLCIHSHAGERLRAVGACSIFGGCAKICPHGSRVRTHRKHRQVLLYTDQLLHTYCLTSTPRLKKGTKTAGAWPI